MTRSESIEMFYKSFQYKEKIDEKTFKKIIDLFNLKASESIAKGEVLKVGFGKFKVVRNSRHAAFKIPNWYLSNSKKKEILSRGGIPFNKETAPDGEEWLIYCDNEFIYKTIFVPFKETAKNVIIYDLKTYKDHRKRVSKQNDLLDLMEL